MTRSAVEASRAKTERLDRILKKLDRQLSDAEDLIGSELSSSELREEFPAVHRLGNDVFTLLEKARWKIRGR